MAAVRRKRAFRLAPDVRPGTVALRVEVDPGESEHFRGEVTISLELAKRRRSIELHAADLRVTRPRLEANGRTLRGAVVPHPERETVEVRLPELVGPGQASLQLAFSGRLRKDLCGLYGARVGERRYAFTQLEPADARRFFPCFDEPAMKARFRVSVTTSAANAAISNGPVERRGPVGDGRVRVDFEPTPPLSSYLVALAVGELEASAPTRAGATEIRVWQVPGKGALTAFSLEAARETLTRLEDYFGLPYPYAKLDLVAVPDFEFGAMENAGAVFFRETLLLVDPETVTLAEKKRAAEVICHELAHMWYGDLVTMAWWDDLWLNEAFATWMAFAIVDAWKPEWKMWRDFQHHRAAALGLDALANTHPIYTKVRTPAEANENFDLVTYEKGASVVRMIERYLGADAFRAGVRAYIRRHRESNARAADLWRALSAASGEDVERVARSWIEQEGYPLVSLRRLAEDGWASVELRQERFLDRAPPRTRARRRGPPPRWPVPWVGRVGSGAPGESRLVRHLFAKARERVDLDAGAARFVYGNADEGGFFRPLHEPSELRAIAAELPSITAVERMGLVNHQWALVRSGRASIATFLDLAGALAEERDPDVLLALGAPLQFVRDQLVEPLEEPVAPRFSRWLERCFGPAFAELGWAPGPEEPDETRLRRAALLGLTGEIAESEPVLKEAAERCRAYLEDRRSLEANLTDRVVALAARGGDAALHESFLAAMRSASTPQEERRFLLALAQFRDPRLVDASLKLALGGEVPTQDVAFLLVGLLANPAAREATWSAITRRWSRVRRRVPPLLISRVVAATPALQTPAQRRAVARFFREHPVPTAERALRQALERFDANAEIRRRAGPETARWLSEVRD